MRRDGGPLGSLPTKVFTRNDIFRLCFSIPVVKANQAKERKHEIDIPNRHTRDQFGGYG